MLPLLPFWFLSVIEWNRETVFAKRAVVVGYVRNGREAVIRWLQPVQVYYILKSICVFNFSVVKVGQYYPMEYVVHFYPAVLLEGMYKTQSGLLDPECFPEPGNPACLLFW